jgi:alcohol dehydrogenase class IV
MNIIKKQFCRCFQTVFRLAIPVLPYREGLILEKVEQIPACLRKKKIGKVLIVTDGFLHISGMLEPLKKALKAFGIAYAVYDEVTPNPTILNVELARERYVAENCQGLIGFGGGSAIDCAKAVGARIARPRLSIPKMKGILKIWLPIPYLIAVPTTAGTGSEATLATVITDHNTSHKFPISDFPLIPKVAVLDPEMTRTLPPHMTSTTGMDALTHAIEAYVGRSTTKQTRAAALEAVRLIAENLEPAYADGNDMQARKNMLRAAYLAGGAFSKSYVGYCHAVAHSLGGQYHIPHGLANAVLLPYILESYGESVYNKCRDLAVAMHLSDHDTPAAEAAHRLIAGIRRMNAAMDIPEKLPGIRSEDIPKLARYADKEANPLYPVPKLMDAKELERFYYDVMEDGK